MFDFHRIPDTYELIRTEDLPEVSSIGAILRHRKTGARVAVLANEDENKVFNIGFRTPPTDSTGVAHITEHSVLCGSERFPAKDPFVELMKGSLNTFLNAMTYPDKTIYPIASCNDADFQNLMHVYLDAVFHPNIYIHDEIFRQEGWHYEMADADSPLIYNGVVYNEMKGAFSSPDDVLQRKISDTLFPDTIYSVESGGDPDVIPSLTYEQFLDFHRRYYHPSNSYIYLYGNMDVAEKLDFIDKEYLSHYDHLEIDSEVADQAPFDHMVRARAEYPVSEDAEDDAAYMSLNWVIGKSTDAKLYAAMQVLSYVLMDAPGALLKTALLKAECGEDIYSVYETSMKQPTLSIIIKKMNPERQDEILDLIRKELTRLADGGLQEKTLESALNFFDFRFRERDFGRWPKGLMFGLRMMDSWLYDDDKPFVHLKTKSIFDELRQGLKTGYFESVIRTWLLDNPHASSLLLIPSKGLAGRREAALKEKLAAIRAAMTEEEREQIVLSTKQLKAYQSEPSPKEILEMIPLLSVSDIRREALPLDNEEREQNGSKVLFHDIETNGIDYVKLIFDISCLTEEEIPYMALFSELMGNMDTDKGSYQDLAERINFHTGGLTTYSTVYVRDRDYRTVPYFVTSGKVFSEKAGALADLMQEILFGTSFKDVKRMKEVMNQMKSRMEMSFMTSGHTVAVNRSAAILSPSAWFKELTEGLEFYRFICGALKDLDEKSETLISRLEAVRAKVLNGSALLLDWTSPDEAYRLGIPSFDKLLDAFERRGEEAAQVLGTRKGGNEAYTTPAMVQYCAVCGDFSKDGLPYNGALIILKNILSSDYLWNNVRVKGGAYGCMCSFGRRGVSYLTSYRDPNLKDTYDIYEAAADYVSQLDLDERELTKYIIGAFGAEDIPYTPQSRGARSAGAYLAGRTIEAIQKTRDEMLSVNNEVLRSLAPVVRSVVSGGIKCVVGDENAIMSCKDLFDEITPLMG